MVRFRPLLRPATVVAVLILGSVGSTRVASLPSPPSVAAGAGILPETLEVGADWIGEGGSPGAWLGWHAESAGDVNGDGFADLIGGAVRFENGQAGEGAAFLYFGGPAGPAAVPDWTFECDQINAACGSAVASAGDVNHDGFDDILVGATGYSNGEQWEGRAFLFLGSASGPGPAPAWTAEANQADAAFGVCVASAGDVNGDGFDDIAVTGSLFDNGETDEGRVWVYLGSSTGPGTVADWSFEPNLAGASLKEATTAGDVNGDGYGDLIVGAGGYGGREGRVFLILGSAAGLGVQPAWEARGAQAGSQFGFMVNSAGDVNGDGFSDVIVGANFYDNPTISEGAAFVWLGGPAGDIGQGTTGTPANADWMFEGNQGSSFLGWCAGAGDVDGDGLDDVVVGHPLYDNGQADEGRILVFFGTPSGPAIEPSLILESGLAGARLGWSAEGAGDVNGDGLADVIAGAARYTSGQFEEGALYLFEGPGRPLTCSDRDGDGFGLPGSAACSGSAAQDCDDARSDVHPGRAETCDGADNDCDAVIDEDADGLDSDADGLPNACDNCRVKSNPDQSDVDADGEGDACDLDDGLILVTPLSAGTIDWQPEARLTSFNLYRGDLQMLRQTGAYTQDPAVVPLALRSCAFPGTSFADITVPPVGSAFFYLITGNCNGTESSLGVDSTGRERPNTFPCPQTDTTLCRTCDRPSAQVLHSTQNDVPAGYRVIDNPSDWATLCSQVGGGQACASWVDFATEVAIVAARGTSPADCFDINIIDVACVETSGGSPSLHVVVEDSVPASGCPCFFVLTFPVDVVKVARPVGTVTFETVTRVVPCP